MPCDLFISYSRLDNVNNRVTELKKQIEADYLEFAKAPLNCFFDQEEIKGMDDWQHRLLQGLKDSHLLLVILSPNYLDSPYCEWEIVEYLKYEYARATQGDGVAQIYFMEISGLDGPGFAEKAKAWIEKVSRRQRFDFRPWYNDGVDSLKEPDVKTRFEELKKSLHDRILRMHRVSNALGNLPAPNVRFVGREREMKLLHKSVGLGKFGVLTALHGMGGLGKTAIAFQYAYAYADFYLGGRWQIRCANETNLASVLKKLDLDLKVSFTEEEKRDDIRGAKRILNELEALAFKGPEANSSKKKSQKPAVLLLLDNVDHAELIQPPNSDLFSGKEWLKVLITTRMGPDELGEDETKQTLLTIDELPFFDALSLLESYQPNGRFKNEDEQEKAGEIVNLLGCFTLAVEVSALYLYECKGRVSCAAFLELLKREGGATGVDIVGAKTKNAINHSKLVSATLAPTLDILSPEETLILSYASLLPPDSIPIPWIRALVIKEFPELGSDTLPGLDDPWLSTLNHLLSLRLLQIVDLDGQIPRLMRIHRLIGEIIRNKQKDIIHKRLDDLTDSIKARCNDLEHIWHQHQWEIMPFIGYAKSLLEIQDHKAAELVRSLCQWLTAFDYGRYSEPLLRATIEHLEKYPTNDYKDMSVTLSNLGWALNDLGRYQEAEKYLRRALEIDENIDNPDNQALVIRYVNLCHCLRLQRKDTESKLFIKKALEIAKVEYGDEHYITATCIGHLGAVENNLGNLKEAKKLLIQTMTFYEKFFESGHPSIANSQHNLALLLRNMGELHEAKKLLIQVLASNMINFEPGHPSIAETQCSLANVLGKLGELQEAQKLLQQALASEEKNFEPGHPTIAVSQSNLATVEESLGNLKEAELLFRSALESRLKSLPKGHKYIRVSYTFLINILNKTGQTIEANKLQIEAMEHETGETT